MRLFTAVLVLLCSIHVYAQKPVKDLRMPEGSLPTYTGRVPVQVRTAALNTCGTWTFQLRLGSDLSEQPVQALQLPTGSYVICGNDSSASGTHGRLVKLSKEGRLLQSKQFSIGSQNIFIQKVRLFSDGLLHGVVTLTDPLTGQSKPLLFTADTTSLALVNTLICQFSTESGKWRATDLTEGRDSSTFLFCYTDSLVNITRFGTTPTSIAWSRTFRPRNTPRPVGLGAERSDVTIAWNETDSGFSKGILMRLDAQNGEYKSGSRVGGLRDSIHVELQSWSKLNQQPRITGVQWKNGIYQPIRINYQNTINPGLREWYTISGFTPDSTTISRQNGWEETLAFQNRSAPNSIHLVHTVPDGYNAPIKGTYVQYNYGVNLTDIFRTYDGGNLVLGRTTSYPFQLVLTKTDSIGTLPGCSATSVSASSKFGQTPFVLDTLLPITNLLQMQQVSLQMADVALFITEDCKTPYCPTPPQPDSCLRTFFKEYRGYGHSMFFNRVADLGNGRFAILGGMRYHALEATSTTISIVDTAGRTLNSQTFPSLILNPAAQQISRLQDGNFLIGGAVSTTGLAGPIFLMKLDPSLNIIWQKRLSGATDYSGILAMIESSEGDIYCYLRNFRAVNGNEVRTILKTDAGGNPVWIKQFAIGRDNYATLGEERTGITELGDGIVVKYNLDDIEQSPHLMRLRKSNGTLVWARKYQMQLGGGINYTLSSIVSDNSFVYMLGTSHTKNVFFKIATDGSIVLAKETSHNTNQQYYQFMSLGKNGQLVVNMSIPLAGNTTTGILELDKNFSLLRSQYMRAPLNATNFVLMPYSDSVVYCTGNLYDLVKRSYSSFLQKYNFNSSFAQCAIPSLPFILSTYTLQVATPVLTENILALPAVTTEPLHSVPAYFAYNGFHCGGTFCSSIDLQGPSLACDTGTVYHFRAVRNDGCTANTVWQMDSLPGQLKVVGSTDSLIQIRLLKRGSFKLKARIYAACGWLEDSLLVTDSVTNTNLDLGRDTVLCAGNTFTLRAGTGFASYLWQDGSRDSVLVVSQPGTYHVQVSTCGTLLKDTVVVSAAPRLPFNAGPDRTKCNNDTIQLSAPSGFLNYSWSNNYNISAQSGQNVVVNPLVDTAYYVKAEKTPGCFAYDTVRIKVFHSPSVNLGNDVSFCSGDSAQFHAGAGFQTYTWSNGTATQQITVKAAGFYSVVCTTADGCKSYDTVQVLRVHPLPVVTLDKGDALCFGTTKTINAGSFAHYQWNTGATTPAITVGGIGSFAVTVTDANGCKGSDSTEITIMHPLPTDFLPLDTAICSYGSLELKSFASFNRYLWNTGNATSSLRIEKPGLYWLEVMDRNSCKGRDSILIKPKDCMKGFYMPSAFTPNRDGRNDLLRPLLYGIVQQYRFTVYNRWGQVVFQTTEWQKGWNGMVNGSIQDSGVFIWMCTYQFEGEQVRIEKGTVTLIR